MRRRERGAPRLAALALALACACAQPREAAPAAGDDAAPAVARAAADSAFADSVLRAAEDIGAEVETRPSNTAAPVRDANEIRLALAAYAAETYLDDLLAARDSNNFRWPDRTRDPLRVWIQTATLDAAEAGWPRLVEEAFLPWTETGIPVAFLFTEDSAAAEIRVTWVARYESRTTGRTRWVRDQHGWITGAAIELARAQPDGRALESAAVRAVALHEIGHLLGLDHARDEANVMAARIRVTELSEADRNTVRLVYRLPPGSLKAPR